MKRRVVNIDISDHAVLRYLERVHELDVDAVRQIIAAKVHNGAQLGAVIVMVDEVKFALKQQYDAVGFKYPKVIVTTVQERKMYHAENTLNAHTAFKKATT